MHNLKIQVLFLLLGLGALPLNCTSQTKVNPSDSGKSDFEVRRITSPTGKVSVSFYDLKNNRAIKTLTQEDLEKINPLFQLPYPQIRQDALGVKTFSLQSLNTEKRRSLLHDIKVNPDMDPADLEVNFISSRPTDAIDLSNRQYIVLSRTCTYYFDDPGGADAFAPPVGAQTDLLVLDAKGDSVTSWKEPYALDWHISDDARYMLLETGFIGGEGEVGLKLINLHQGKQMYQFNIFAEEPNYSLQRSSFESNMFILTYKNYSDKMLRLIINPYQGIAYYKVYEAPYDEADFEGKLVMDDFPNAEIDQEVKSYKTIRF